MSAWSGHRCLDSPATSRQWSGGSLKGNKEGTLLLSLPQQSNNTGIVKKKVRCSNLENPERPARPSRPRRSLSMGMNPLPTMTTPPFHPSRLRKRRPRLKRQKNPRKRKQDTVVAARGPQGQGAPPAAPYLALVHLAAPPGRPAELANQRAQPVTNEA